MRSTSVTARRWRRPPSIPGRPRGRDDTRRDDEPVSVELWSLNGQPAPDTLDSSRARDRPPAYPNHPGANHYYIHAVEASPTPERARQRARLETPCPAPGISSTCRHIYAHRRSRPHRVAQPEGGRRRRALLCSRIRRASIRSYYAHNLHFVVVGTWRRAATTTRAWRRRWRTCGAARRGEMAPMAEWVIALRRWWTCGSRSGRDPRGAEAAGVADAGTCVRLRTRAVALQDDREEAEASAAAGAFEADARR